MGDEKSVMRRGDLVYTLDVKVVGGFVESWRIHERMAARPRSLHRIEQHNDS